MAGRIGLGPVFGCEWRIAARQWRHFGLRSLFVAGLLVGMIVVYWNGTGRAATTLRSQAEFGVGFFYAIVGVQLALVMLAAPAATAGAICLDKARGTLLHLMMTDLSDAEIVLGKLAARLVPTLMLVGSVLPVMALGTLLGGIDPIALLSAFLITLGVAILGCTLALTLSVWGRKSHEVLLGTYAFWVLWLLAYPMAGHAGSFTSAGPDAVIAGWINDALRWIAVYDPFRLAFAPYVRPGSTGFGDAVAFLAACLVGSIGLSALSVLRVRPVALRQWNEPRKGRRGRSRFATWRLPAPPLDWNPVLWREWHRARPSRGAALVLATYAVLALCFSVVGMNSHMVGAWTNGLQVSIGLLLLSVFAATSLAEERVRGSLDVLMATPLPTRSIVFGKWFGVFRFVPLLAILPALVILPNVAGLIIPMFRVAPAVDTINCLVSMTVLILMQGAAVTSLGLALSTWFTRQSRVLALTVSAVVFVTVGWLFLCLTFRGGLESECWAMASPFMGAGNVTYWLGTRANGTGGYPKHVPNFAWGWAGAYAMAAVGLLGTTLITFNRCLGRVEGAIAAREPGGGRLQPIPWSIVEAGKPKPPGLDDVLSAREI